MPPPEPIPDEPGILLGTILLGVLASLIAAFIAVGGIHFEHWHRGGGAILLGIVFAYVAVLVLLGYFVRHKSFLFRMFMRFCDSAWISRSPGNFMAFVWAGWLFVCTGTFILKGLRVW